jgi:pSer/pThr/pTyr-binding forkhead associated (FHA) protein
MKSTRITLTVEQGRFEGKEFVFTTPKLCLVGRSDDCDLQLPVDPEYANVSRHHCLFEIDPPAARVRDLGSRNGTFLNELNIGQRRRRQSPEAADPDQFTAYELQHGDTVRVGSTVLRVGIAETADISEPMSLPMYFV